MFEIPVPLTFKAVIFFQLFHFLSRNFIDIYLRHAQRSKLFSYCTSSITALRNNGKVKVNFSALQLSNEKLGVPFTVQQRHLVTSKVMKTVQRPGTRVQLRGNGKLLDRCFSLPTCALFSPFSWVGQRKGISHSQMHTPLLPSLLFPLCWELIFFLDEETNFAFKDVAFVYEYVKLELKGKERNAYNAGTIKGIKTF